MKKKALRFESLFLSLALVLTCLVPGFSNAVSNIEASAVATHEIEITDASGNIVTEQISVMESEQVQLSYKLIDCSMPQNGYVVWKSDTPLNASVDQTGLVRGHDSSKGAAVRLWLENDVKTIPIIGKTLAKTLESVLYSDNINLDTMDTESIVTLVGETLGVSSGALAESLTSSLRKRLDTLGTNITIELYDQYDSIVATDSVHVIVTNSDKWYANVLPNGAFIVNKDSLPTTVAVGGKLTLEGGVTPLRLGYGVTWELEAPSILDKAEDYATFDPATGEIVFLKTGKVTVKVYPNADDIVANLMGYINDLAALGNEVDTSDIADIVVKVLGLNVSTSTVKFAIDIIAAIAGAGTNAADMLTQATKYVANWILEASINDKITFNIVDSLEIKSFSIGGNLEVAEGKTSQLYITDIVPAGANSTNVVWSVADESIAYVDKYGILIGRDAGGITGLNKKTTTVTATVDGISASADVTVTGALITQPVDIKIEGPSVVELGSTVQYSATVFPDRSNATIRWGLINNEGKVVFAKDNSPVSNDFGTIDADGNFTSTNGGLVEIVAKAGTISTCQRSYTVYVGTLAQGIDIDQGDYLVVEVPGTKTYNSMSAQLTVTFNPPNASNQNVRWSVLEGNNIEVSPSGVVKPSKNRAAWGVIQAKSFDGGYTDTIAVSFANYPVTGISVSPTTAELIVGNTVDINETVKPLGTGAEGAKIGDASIKAVRWSSTDETVAVVDGNGVVTAVDSGTCEIIATTRDGGFEARATVTVRPDKTRLNYAIALFESGKVTAENCAPEDWAALEAAYNQAIEIQGMEFAYQSSCDKAAQAIITLYDKVGAYVPLYGVDILLDGVSAPDYNSIKVDTSKSYKDFSIDLDATFIPENAMYASVKWVSSNPGALTVDQNGVCRPAKNAACWAQIKYTATDYMGNIVSDSVIVSFANYPVTGVTLDYYNINDALVYNTGKLTPTIEPKGFLGAADASIKDVMWSSSNTDVATVDQNGNLTYKTPGTAVITVTTVDGGYTASCIVKVSVNKTALAQTIADMDAYQLVEEEWTRASFNEYMAAYDNAKYVMENEDIDQKIIDAARQDLIDAYKGLVRFIKTEKVTIQVKGDEGLVDAPEFISVKYTTSTLQLTARITPLDSMYTSVIWSTDSSSIVVDENGLVKAKSSTAAGYGWVTVTVTDERGNVYTDKVHVSFALYPVTHVELTPEVIETSLDEAPAKIKAVCKHKATDVVTHDASIQKVYWTSDNETAVTVDENGQLTYHNAGQATITATAADGGLQVTCLVTVAGDKSKLREAIAKADEAQIDIQEHTYETSMEYVAAYEHATEVEASVLYTQEEIDAAAERLLASIEALQPYIHMTELNVYYEGVAAPSFIPIKVSTLKPFTSYSVTLTYDYAPADAMFKSIEWSSSNENISCENGVIKPIKNKACGAAITLTATDHYDNKIVKTVYVAFGNYEPTGISIDTAEMSVPYGEQPHTITATVSHNTTDYLFNTYGVKDVVWRTTDSDVATVENGVVTFVEAGSCQILASTVYGGFTAVCEVTVYSDKTPLEEALGEASYAYSRKDEYSIESWEPFEAAYIKAQEIHAIDNPKQRDINAAAQALSEAYKNLDRYIKVQKVSIRYGNSTNYTHISKDLGVAAIYTNQSIQLSYVYQPTNATFETATWTSSNGSISIDENGFCKPTENKACWSIITITLTDKKDRTFSDSVYVSFAKTPVENVSISYDQSTNAVVGGTKQLTANISPNDADIKAVTWSTSDESLAVVDENGLVTFLNTGEVEITATTCDGGKTSVSTIKIYADKSELNEVMTYVEELEYTEFTPASWAVLQEKYNTALEVFNNADPTQEEVNNVRIALSDAISKLVEYVYISDVKISCDGNTAQNINVIVPEGEPYIGAYANLSFVVNPENAMYAVTEWSYDGTIVHNPASGIVAPSENKPCFGKIYLTLTDDFGNKYETMSYVTFARNPVASVELSSDLIETNVNAAPVQLNATVFGINGGLADISEVIWTSSNPNVASVDENGLVTFLAGGYTEIKAESIVGGYHAICKVYVTTDKSALQAVLQKTIDENYQRLDYIETTYNAYLEAYDNAVIVFSNNEASQKEIDDATAWLTNAINALEPYIHVDSIIITANSDKNVTANGDYFTYEDPGSVVNNRTIKLNCTLNPANAMYETIEWTSDNASKISVDQNGLVKSLTNTQQAATITITVTDYYGVKYVKNVHVSFIKWASASVTGVSISHSEISGTSGGNFTLSHEIKKSGIGEPEIKDVIWTSSNENVATVNSDGKVFFIDSGECYITVTTVQGGFSASCKVKVTATEAKLKLAKTLERAKAYDSALYTEETYKLLSDVIPQAQAVYDTFYATTTQINEAIALIENAESQLVFIPADYKVVYDAIDRFEALNNDYYKPEDIQAIQTIIDGIDFTLDVSQKSIVDQYATDINTAIDNLVELDADFTTLREAINRANEVNRDIYENIDTLDAPLSAAITASGTEYKISQQAELDAITNALNNAIEGLVLKAADKKTLNNALKLKLTSKYIQYYDAELLAEWEALVAEGQEMAANEELTILDNEIIKAKAQDIMMAYAAVEASYNVVIDKSVLENAVAEAEKVIVENYVVDEAFAEYESALAAGRSLLEQELTEEEDQVSIDTTAERILNSITALNLKTADYSEVNEAIERFNNVDKFIYTDDSFKAVQDIIDAVVYDLDITNQSTVDKYAEDINAAIDNLVLTEETFIIAIESVGSTVNAEDKFIYGVDEGLSSVEEYVRVINGTVNCTETENGLGTGAMIEVVDDNGEVVDNYTLVVFGDVNGDGLVDGQDSLLIWMIIWTGEVDDKAIMFAADANKDGIVNETDAELVEQAGVYKATVEQR